MHFWWSKACRTLGMNMEWRHATCAENQSFVIIIIIVIIIIVIIIIITNIITIITISSSASSSLGSYADNQSVGI